MFTIEDATKLVAERQGAPVEDEILDKKAYTDPFTGWVIEGKFIICPLGDLEPSRWYDKRDVVIDGKLRQIPTIPVMSVDTGELIQVDLHRLTNACCGAGVHTKFEQKVAALCRDKARKELPAVIGGLSFQTKSDTQRINGGKETYHLHEL